MSAAEDQKTKNSRFERKLMLYTGLFGAGLFTSLFLQHNDVHVQIPHKKDIEAGKAHHSDAVNLCRQFEDKVNGKVKRAEFKLDCSKASFTNPPVLTVSPK